jgi:hypothetical protein
LKYSASTNEVVNVSGEIVIKTQPSPSSNSICQFDHIGDTGGRLQPGTDQLLPAAL